MTKTVIINSIGSANPTVSKILAEAFEMEQSMIVRLLYNAPSVLFHNIEPDLALKAQQMLIALGLEIIVQDSTMSLPTLSEAIDVAIYLNNPLLLPKISEELAQFLGCDTGVAFNLLLAEPSVILGSVSMATAHALSKRIDAEVLTSQPKQELYTLKMLGSDTSYDRQIENILKNFGVVANLKEKRQVENLNYKTSQEIWRKFHSTAIIKIINQEFQRYEIILQQIDETKPGYKNILDQHVGIPMEIIDEVLANLPVIIDESVSQKIAGEKLELYESNGLLCQALPLSSGEQLICLENILDLEKTKNILSSFYTPETLPQSTHVWKAVKPLPLLLARYAAAQLETHECVETVNLFEYEQQ